MHLMHVKFIISPICADAGRVVYESSFALLSQSSLVLIICWQVHIHVNNPPSRGSFRVTPEKGVALTTEFLLGHEGWMVRFLKISG